jgi:hypothetical protein
MSEKSAKMGVSQKTEKSDDSKKKEEPFVVGEVFFVFLLF